MQANDVEALEDRASTLMSAGAPRQALRVRETLLLVKQKAFNDPSPECDAEKLHIAETIYSIATQESVLGPSQDVPKASPPSQLPGSQPATICDTLPTAELIAFGLKLIAKGNTLPETQAEPHTDDLKAKLYLAQANVMHLQKRPRAAIPVVEKAIVLLRRLAAPPTHASEDMATALLSLAALHSSASHHREALKAAQEALTCVLGLEEVRWATDPETAMSVLSASSVDERSPNESQALPPAMTRNKVYYGALQAVCYHNIAAEQEHLGLLELALDHYQAGYELSYVTHGPRHSLTARLKQCYADLFTSLHYKHFAGKQKNISGTFKNADKALAQLNSTYVTSLRHKTAVSREEVAQRAEIRRAGAPVGRSRPTSAMSRPASGMSRRPASAMSRSSAKR